jgi:hypothetical protein
MNLRMLTAVAAIVGCGACGGSSPTAPASPSAPPSSSNPSRPGTWVDAVPITVGTVEGNPNVGNTIPFGGTVISTSAGTTYQQAYLGSIFGTSQIRVTAVEFFAAPANGTREVASGIYTWSMSTTAKAVDALDSTNLPSNVGTNQQIVFSGALGPGSIVDSRLRITFSNAFLYSPAAGNLLLQMARSSAGPNTMAAFLNHRPDDGFPSGQSGRAHDFGNNAAPGPSTYLVTRFHNQRCQCPDSAPCFC